MKSSRGTSIVAARYPTLHQVKGASNVWRALLGVAAFSAGSIAACVPLGQLSQTSGDIAVEEFDAGDAGLLDAGENDAGPESPSGGAPLEDAGA